MAANPAGGPRVESVSGGLTDLITHHMALAAYLHSWAEDLRGDQDLHQDPHDEGDFMLGYQRALRDLAGHLRAGDALPGGPLIQVAGAA